MTESQQQKDLRHDEMLAGTTTVLGEPSVDVTDARQNSLWSDAWGTLRRSILFWIGAVLGVLFVAMALVPSLFTRGADPQDCSLTNSSQTPSAEHWFGFDQQGCDYMATIVYGARNSLLIGMLGVIGVLVLGVVVGAVAGFYGRFTDSILSRLTDIFYALPLVLGALVLLRTGRPGRAGCAVRRDRPGAVRLDDRDAAGAVAGDRGEELGLRRGRPGDGGLGRPHPGPAHPAQRGRAGAGLRHDHRRRAHRRRGHADLPGRRVAARRPSRGGCRSTDGQRLLRTAPHLVLFPSLILTLTVMAFILMGDALRDALDPRQRA